MRRIKTEAVILGNGGAAIFAANRFSSLGMRVALVNPSDDFEFDDVRPYSGLGLWNAAYRTEDVSLADLYDMLLWRMREVFPASVDQSGLSKREHWSVLSSTLVHRTATEELEKEFFRLERKPWSSGQFRLVNPENVLARARGLGLDLSRVSQVEGGVVRAYGLWWNAPQVARYLSQFLQNKFSPEGPQYYFKGASIKGRYGRKLVLLTNEGDEVSLEPENGLYIFLTGDLLPSIKSIVAACEESWIQGVRKRVREQHFVWLDRQGTPKGEEPLWLDIGSTRYHWSNVEGRASWQAGKGPDGLEHVVDEALRLQLDPYAGTRFVRNRRAFRLEWEWRHPQWRETSHQTYWATAFEGDLWNIMELLWNLPSR